MYFPESGEQGSVEQIQGVGSIPMTPSTVATCCSSTNHFVDTAFAYGVARRPILIWSNLVVCGNDPYMAWGNRPLSQK